MHKTLASFEPFPAKRIWFSFEARADTTSSVSPPLTSEADESLPCPVPGEGVRHRSELLLQGVQPGGQ